MSTEHSPLPWVVGVHEGDDFQRAGQPFIIQADSAADVDLDGDPDPRYIATIGCDSPADGWGDEDHANAEFIVRAVNCHDELLGCLRSYVELEESAAPYSSSPMREKARAAIAKAEGGVS